MSEERNKKEKDAKQREKRMKELEERAADDLDVGPGKYPPGTYTILMEDGTVLDGAELRKSWERDRVRSEELRGEKSEEVDPPSDAEDS